MCQFSYVDRAKSNIHIDFCSLHCVLKTVHIYIIIVFEMYSVCNIIRFILCSVLHYIFQLNYIDPFNTTGSVYLALLNVLL